MVGRKRSMVDRSQITVCRAHRMADYDLDKARRNDLFLGILKGTFIFLFYAIFRFIRVLST